jgi:hypothetical protein
MASCLKVAAFLILLCLPGVDASAGQTGRASLAGQPVHEAEFAFYADQLRTEVASRFMREHGTGQSEAFWETPVDGISPQAVLEKEVLRAIARDRALQELAVEKGLLEEVLDYPQLVAAFHAENQRRRSMKDRGEVFYGPVQFRQDVWFKVWFGQLFKALQKVDPEIEPQLDARVAHLLNPSIP